MQNLGNPRRLHPVGCLIVVGGLVAAAVSSPQAWGEETPEAAAPKAAAAVVLSRGEDPSQVGLWALKAPVGEIADAMERELGCEIELEGKLQEFPLTAKLSLRSPERLFPALARRLNCRLTVRYKLGRPPDGSPYGKTEGLFAERPAPASLPRTVKASTLVALLKREGIAVETDPAIPPEGIVHPPRDGLALRVTLDFLSRATRQLWWPVVRFTPRKSVDAAAEAEDRIQTNYTDLLAFTPEERQEEIEADLDALDHLPLDARNAALARMVGDVSGLGTLFDRTPGEHRDGIRARLRQIGADYWAVLFSFPADRRVELRGLIDTVRELRERLREPR